MARREDGLSVKEFIASEEAFARENGKPLFEGMLSCVVPQMDVESLEVVYPAPIADGFNAPALEEQGECDVSYRSTRSAFREDEITGVQFDSKPVPQSTETFGTRYPVASYFLVYRRILRGSVAVRDDSINNYIVP